MGNGFLARLASSKGAFSNPRQSIFDLVEQDRFVLGQADRHRLLGFLTTGISKVKRHVGKAAGALPAARVGRFRTHLSGIGIDPLSLLDTLPLDFIKIDGSLMQGLPGDELLQSKVGSLIDAARGREIETIGERVEDANTMAVLWQLGVQHLQGFLIQAPEEVTISTTDTQTVPVLRGNQPVAPSPAVR